MKQKPVITISRTCGSGGREIGKKLSQALGIAFYDRELIAIAAQETGIHTSVLERLDETLSHKKLLHLPGSKDIETMDSLFMRQEDAIRQVARNPCVIVGRCADYVLRGQENVLRLFLYANIEARRARVVREYGVDPKEADGIIRKVDKERAAYYNYHTDYVWGEIDQYDLCVNTSNLSDINVVKTVCAYIDLLD